MNKKAQKTRKYRAIALLTKEETEFLEKLSMDSLFSTGHKMSKTEIISALIQAAKELNISIKGMRTKEEFVKNIILRQEQKNERRLYPRLRRGLLMGIRKADSLEEYKDRTTKNVSLGGFMIELEKLEELYKVNQVIELTIKDGESFNALGRVIWINQNRESSLWEIGIQLIYIREEDLERMKKNLNLFTLIS